MLGAVARQNVISFKTPVQMFSWLKMSSNDSNVCKEGDNIEFNSDPEDEDNEAEHIHFGIVRKISNKTNQITIKLTNNQICSYFLDEITITMKNDQVMMKRSVYKAKPCICGADLTKVKVSQCYGGAGVQCDGCGSSIDGSLLIYHCTHQRKDVHEFGFDLCQTCGDALESISTLPTSKAYASQFLVISNALRTRSQWSSPFKWQQLCYFVHGSPRKRISLKTWSSSFHSISDYLHMMRNRREKQSYIKFNKKSISFDQSHNLLGNAKKDQYEGTLNHGDNKSISSFPALIANRNDNAFTHHIGFKKAMNVYQNNDKDIRNLRQSESNKWSVVGLIDPDKHLSTLDHSLNDELNHIVDVDSQILNYHHWIPSVFQVNSDLTECTLLSEIPNLDPYKYSKTLYRFIERLFLHQVPQLENVTNYKLRNVPLQVIIKAQDYQMFDCQEDDAYVGGIHKEGLYENIGAVALYYYHVDEGISGGELEVSSVINVEASESYYGVTELQSTRIAVKEGTSLVFSNELCYHRVCTLYGTGSRKILAFFLIAPGLTVNIPIDARFVVVNWEHHAKFILLKWLEEWDEGYDWILDIVCAYVVGDKAYVEKAIEMYNKCRRAYHHEITYHKMEITSTGRRRYVRTRRHRCNRD
eukprot:1011198_1